MKPPLHSGFDPALPVGEAARSLVEAIELKDRVTSGHGKRVAVYAVRIAACLPEPLTGAELERLRLAALLHDVGKIGIDDHILKKESALDDSEQQAMRFHPEIGFQILSQHEELAAFVDGMRFHHERWDGTGYPHGLAGEAIPQIARLVAVADAYDAMVSTRPYRRGIGVRAACEQILLGSGSQFDPTVVEAFARAFVIPSGNA